MDQSKPRKMIAAVEARCERELTRLARLWDKARRHGETAATPSSRLRGWRLARDLRHLHFKVDAIRMEMREIRGRMKAQG